MITTVGKEQIKKYFGQQVADVGNFIALGVATNAAALGDTKLGFEVVRVPVTARADLANSRIIYKGTVLPGQIGTVYEIGLVSATLAANGKTVPILPGLNSAWSGATTPATNARSDVSTVAVNVAANGTGNAELTGLGYDLSTFTAGDSVALSFFADANLSSFRIRVGQSSAAYREYAVTTPTAGYQTVRVPFSSGTNTGSPDLKSITYLAVRPSAKSAGATTLYLDGIRFEDNTNGGILVARSVLATPTVMDTTVSTDVEYSLAINV